VADSSWQLLHNTTTHSHIPPLSTLCTLSLAPRRLIAIAKFFVLLLLTCHSMLLYKGMITCERHR